MKKVTNIIRSLVLIIGIAAVGEAAYDRTEEFTNEATASAAAAATATN